MTDPETSQMIVNLGTTTAIALGAATAMNMLSHHLTVNVFWVWYVILLAFIWEIRKGKSKVLEPILIEEY